MTDASELLRLAGLCEAASGPDRALDVLIGCAVGYVPDKPGCEWAKADHWQYVPVPRISERIGCADRVGNVAAHWEAPAYTASLDAAMTLVPEGMIVLVANSAIKGRKADLSRACSHVGIPDEAASYGPTDAATMPLALCAASLRAIALTQGQNT